MQNRVKHFQQILEGVIDTDPHRELTVDELLDVKFVHSDLEKEIKAKLEPILSEIESSQAEEKDMNEFFQFMKETKAKLENAIQQPELAALVKVDQAIHHALDDHAQDAAVRLHKDQRAASKALANSGLFTRVGFDKRQEMAINTALNAMSSESDSDDLSTIEEMSVSNESSPSFGR